MIRLRERLYGYLYRGIMKIAHRWHWHYAPPLYPDGDTMLWCQWCGFRQVVSRERMAAARASVLAAWTTEE